MVQNKYMLNIIFNLARLCLTQIIFWIIVLPSNSINTFYDLFRQTNISPISHMKHASNIEHFPMNWIMILHTPGLFHYSDLICIIKHSLFGIRDSASKNNINHFDHYLTTNMDQIWHGHLTRPCGSRAVVINDDDILGKVIII